MFQIGEMVVYGNSGVCEILDIATLEMDSAQKGKLYYKLVPKETGKGVIYSPVGNEKVKMRKLMTKKEAEVLMNEVSEINTLQITDEKQRERCYKEAMQSSDLKERIKMVKTLYWRKKKRLSEGKKITAIDTKYLRMVEEMLYFELAVVLGLEKEQMEDYIIAREKDLVRS